MLALAAERTEGAHPYFTPVEHTAEARAIMGPDAVLAPEVAVVFDSDPSRAREVARQYMAMYLALPNYANNLKRLGWDESDITSASDAIVDAIVGWGSTDAVLARIKAHLDAGADHVCVQVLGATPGTVPVDQWRELAAATKDW
jgi:probable F420-dependent oxidoreductase